MLFIPSLILLLFWGETKHFGLRRVRNKQLIMALCQNLFFFFFTGNSFRIVLVTFFFQENRDFFIEFLVKITS